MSRLDADDYDIARVHVVHEVDPSLEAAFAAEASAIFQAMRDGDIVAAAKIMMSSAGSHVVPHGALDGQSAETLREWAAYVRRPRFFGIGRHVPAAMEAAARNAPPRSVEEPAPTYPGEWHVTRTCRDRKGRPCRSTQDIEAIDAAAAVKAAVATWEKVLSLVAGDQTATLKTTDGAVYVATRVAA